jgi:tRNA dimethylallyltransferase
MIRAEILKEAHEKGWQYLHEKLQRIDPIAAARIHPNDPQRLQRALEVYEITGESLTDLQSKQTKDKLPYEFINVGLMPDDDRELLREKIKYRFLQMLELGLIDEVKKLYERGDLHLNLPALRAVGYRQVWEYLEGKIDEKQMQENVTVATCQLAKRQMTWLRQWPEVQKINPQYPQVLEEVIKIFGVL